MQTTININGKPVEITLTPEQIAQITEATKHKLFEYTERDTYYIGANLTTEHYSCDGDNEYPIKYGRLRRTEKAAEIDFKRQTRMMRLSALAWEVGECVEFDVREDNYFVTYINNEWQADAAKDIYDSEKVYMTKDTAIKVCEILNSSEYFLDVE